MGVLKQFYLNGRGAQMHFSVHFDPTYRCHQRCLHCYLPKSWRRRQAPESELSSLEIKNILDQLAAAGTFFPSFSGGEIFLPGSSPGGCDAGINGCYINPLGETWPCVFFLLPWASLENGGRFEQVWYDSPRLCRVRNLQKRLDPANEKLCLHQEQCNNMG
jgi:MoaA/NifB/PqqE/SkfB family radical SAM enzyme